MRENKITNVLTTIVLFIISVLSFAAFPNSSYSEIKTVNVSIVFDGPSPLNSNTLSLYKEEITKITEGEFIVNFPENKIITSDWNYINIQRIIDQILSDPQVDILITAGVISSYEVSKRIDLSKPVIAPFIIDQKLQSIPINDSGSSGINNLNYISGGSVIDREFKVFHDIVNFKKLAFVFMSFIPERFPELKNNVKNSTEKINADIVFIPAGNSAKEVLELIPDDVDAIYITSLLTFSEQEISNLISGINNRKLPSFSMLGREEVSKGVLISLNSDTDFLRIARRVALNFQDILLGNNAGSLPVAFKNQEELVINMETARSINFFPEWKWLTEADVLYEDISDIKRKISLKSAVEESVRLNLDLLTARQEVEVGKENVRQAISQLLPQINTALDYTIIDEDRAESFSGSQSERTFTGSINLEQSIFSEPLWSNLGIQKNLQEARRANKKITELDIIQSTAIAYLNVLITKTFEKTQKENLKVTKSNLELAKIRNEVGEASPSEVFRWESELASDRVDVVTAEAETKKAQITLNRLLHRPLNEMFDTAEDDISEPSLFFLNDERMDQYINNPGSFEIFINYMVKDGFVNSPEIESIDSQIKAKQKQVRSNKLSFLIPDFDLSASLDEQFHESGSGSNVDLLPGFSLPDDTNWSLFLTATFPLFRGGAKFSEYSQAKKEYQRLLYEKSSVEEKIEENIRNSMQDATASYPSIEFSRDAAIAAQKNLELVKDSYSRGVLSILDLLDAQNAALSAELNSSTAVYNFLIDLMNIQRSIGKFNFFYSEEEKEKWFNDLDYFYNQSFNGNELVR